MTSRGIVALISAFLGVSAVQAARPLVNVVPQETAQRYGLERAWATQIELDPARGRVAGVSLQAGLLLVQTDQATVHVLDAETRRTLWVGHVGLPGAITSPPAANDKYVVSTNGSVLYLFDRRTGTVLWTRKMPSVPSTGAALSSSRIYVPQVSGMISTFRLPAPNRDETPAEQRFKDNALNYTGKGIAFEPPIVTRSSVVWGTDAGNIYSVTPDQLLAVFRFKCRDSVLGALMYREPYIYAASRDGYVYALRDQKGFARWQVSIGKAIAQTPMATDAYTSFLKPAASTSLRWRPANRSGPPAVCSSSCRPARLGSIRQTPKASCSFSMPRAALTWASSLHRVRRSSSSIAKTTASIC